MVFGSTLTVHAGPGGARRQGRRPPSTLPHGASRFCEHISVLYGIASSTTMSCTPFAFMAMGVGYPWLPQHGGGLGPPCTIGMSVGMLMVHCSLVIKHYVHMQGRPGRIERTGPLGPGAPPGPFLVFDERSLFLARLGTLRTATMTANSPEYLRACQMCQHDTRHKYQCSE